MESNTERKKDKRAKPVTQFLALVSELLSIENKEDIRESRIPRLPNKVKIEFLNVTGIICGNPARYFPAILIIFSESSQRESCNRCRKVSREWFDTIRVRQ